MYQETAPKISLLTIKLYTKDVNGKFIATKIKKIL